VLASYSSGFNGGWVWFWVVIARQGQTYTVLTSQHVVADSKDGYYSVLSADGMTHPAHRKAVRHLDIDLVQFE